MQGEFSLSVVDMAVLALADPNVPPITTAFYGTQGLAVRTALSLAAYGQRLAFMPPGMGGGDGGMAPSVARENFPDTAYWNAAITTDSNGEATLTVDLPDNLTTWLVDVRGIDDQSRVGQAELRLSTTKDLLVRPVRPLFLVVGDHTDLAAVVHNNTRNEISASVSLQAEDSPSTKACSPAKM